MRQPAYGLLRNGPRPIRFRFATTSAARGLYQAATAFVSSNIAAVVQPAFDLACQRLKRAGLTHGETLRLSIEFIACLERAGRDIGIPAASWPLLQGGSDSCAGSLCNLVLAIFNAENCRAEDAHLRLTLV